MCVCVCDVICLVFCSNEERKNEKKNEKKPQPNKQNKEKNKTCTRSTTITTSTLQAFTDLFNKMSRWSFWFHKIRFRHTKQHIYICTSARLFYSHQAQIGAKSDNIASVLSRLKQTRSKELNKRMIFKPSLVRFTYQ